MIVEFSEFRFDDTLFNKTIEETFLSWHKREKSPRKNRYNNYCAWAIQLLKKTSQNKKTWESFLWFSKKLLERDIKSETEDNA